MLYRHYSQIPPELWRWENFEPDEPGLACPCCGEFFLDFQSMDGLQAIRSWIGRPIRINSGHRCRLHNARVGGAPLSQHKKFAADIRLGTLDRKKLLSYARAAGFTGFGLYHSFLHVDRGPRRHWIAKGVKKSSWNF